MATGESKPLCRSCETRHLPGENTRCPGFVAYFSDVATEVETEVETACSDSPSGKTQEHFKSRRKLFEEVDRLIRGRVREVLPGITLEFKQQIDKDLGLDALRVRVQRVADGVSKDTDALSTRLAREVGERVDGLFERLEQEVSDTILAMFVRKAGVLVAKEVGKQIGQLLARPPAAPPARTKKKKRARK